MGGRFDATSPWGLALELTGDQLEHVVRVALQERRGRRGSRRGCPRPAGGDPLECPVVGDGVGGLAARGLPPPGPERLKYRLVL